MKAFICDRESKLVYLVLTQAEATQCATKLEGLRTMGILNDLAYYLRNGVRAADTHRADVNTMFKTYAVGVLNKMYHQVQRLVAINPTLGGLSQLEGALRPWARGTAPENSEAVLEAMLAEPRPVPPAPPPSVVVTASPAPPPTITVSVTPNYNSATRADDIDV